MKQVLWRIILLVLLCSVVLLACEPGPASQVPAETGDGWQTTSPGEVGLDDGKLSQAAARIRGGAYENVHSLLVVKDGKLVFEEYFPGYTWSYSGEQFRGRRVDFDRDTLHNLASVTKSFTSALVGIAIDQGFMGGVDDPDLDMVVIFTGGNYVDESPVEEIVTRHILPAVQ